MTAIERTIRDVVIAKRILALHNVVKICYKLRSRQSSRKRAPKSFAQSRTVGVVAETEMKAWKGMAYAACCCFVPLSGKRLHA
jgi:hypothetical protein